MDPALELRVSVGTGAAPPCAVLKAMKEMIDSSMYDGELKCWLSIVFLAM